MGREHGPHAGGPADSEQTEFDALAFRHTLGHLATGITVISTDTPEGVHGMTANAVTSVSLSPPLILICVDRRARTARYIQSSGRFGVNILRDTQEPLSRLFAGSLASRSHPPEQRFEPWAGIPYLVGSLGGLSCRVADIHDGGDHLIVVARVVGLRVDDPDGKPLLYYRGRYAGLVERDTGPAEEQALQTNFQFQIYHREWEPEDEASQRDAPGPGGIM